ncbi:hypothetical protein Taro_029215 [Colocasia esculenta]|uniref:Uncharacterized protein n=1 Tax=Colocasia esculenta TaxID=4460 RepID=A0A843VJB0_COLES|nr:hypothetical protein [Colocasia esculenta]
MYIINCGLARQANRPGLARFGFGNAAARPVAFLTRPEGRPRHSSYRGVSRRHDNRGGPVKHERGSQAIMKGRVHVQTLFAKEVSTHPTMLSTQHLSIKGKKVDALSGQVDTGLSSQNSMFADLGQQVDATPEQVDTGPCSQNILFSVWDSVSTPPPGQKPLKHIKEADPVEAFVGEEFKEDPTIPKCRASVLDFKIASLFPIQASTREYT